MPPTPASKGVVANQPPAKAPAAAAKPGKPAAPDAPKPDDVAPPDEQFWQRYAPNGEPMLSGLASFVVHAVVLTMILLGVLSWFNSSAETEELEPVLVGDGIEGGGGGNLQGEGAGPQLSKKEDVNEDLNKPKDTTPDKPVEDVQVKNDNTPKLADDPENIIEQIKQKKPAASAGVFLKDALEGVTGGGKGGKGFGGGEGNGVGTGKGDKEGPGTGPNNRRGRRVLRWVVNFNTQDGADYVRQLSMMGAIVGVPDTNGRLMMIRNLTERPVKPTYESVKDLKRIFWVDEREESARSVAEALELNLQPKQIVAFFPEEIENQILDVEMEYAFKGKTDPAKDKKKRDAMEDRIVETVFNVSFRAGRPAFSVVSMRRK